MKHFVNKSLGKRCLLKLYYSELPDVESDLVISQVVDVSTTCSIQLSTWATVKAGTQERGTERGTEVRCKVRLDERSCAHCEVYLLAV